MIVDKQSSQKPGTSVSLHVTLTAKWSLLVPEKTAASGHSKGTAELAEQDSGVRLRVLKPLPECGGWLVTFRAFAQASPLTPTVRLMRQCV